MERYYTVDEIANMLSMHPKTIQRYIREDKLHAKKVGKSWRIYEQDLKVFMECSNITSDIMPQTPNKTVASSVVDINVTDSNEAFDIEKYLRNRTKFAVKQDTVMDESVDFGCME